MEKKFIYFSSLQGAALCTGGWLPFQDNIIGAKIRGLGTRKLPKESEVELK
jgi:hypothetical protein